MHIHSGRGDVTWSDQQLWRSYQVLHTVLPPVALQSSIQTLVFCWATMLPLTPWQGCGAQLDVTVAGGAILRTTRPAYQWM